VEAICALLPSAPGGGCLIATGGSDGRVCLWHAGQRPLDAPPAAAAFAFVGEGGSGDAPPSPVRALARADAGGGSGWSLAVGGWGGGVSWWSVQAEPPATATVTAARLAARRHGAGGPVWALAALASGGLASGGADGQVALWLDPGRGAAAPPVYLQGHTEDVDCLARLACGRLASGSLDGTVRLWSVSDPGRAACDRVLLGHSEPVVCLAPLPCGGLASGSSDGTILLWDTAAGEEGAAEEEEAAGPPCVVAPFAAFLSLICPPLVALDAAHLGEPPPAGRRRRRRRLLAGQPARRGVAALVALRTGQLAAGCGDGSLLLWQAGDVTTSSSRAAAAAAQVRVIPSVAPRGAAGCICLLEEGADGGQRLAVAVGGSVRVYEAEGGEAEGVLLDLQSNESD